MALTQILPDYILANFRHDVDLGFSRLNMEFALSQPKVIRLPHNQKQTYRLYARPQIWPSGLTLAMALTLHFESQIWTQVVRLPRNKKQIYRLNSMPQMWPSDLTLAMILTFLMFKVKYGIHYILWQNDPITVTRKMNFSIEHQASNVVISFVLGWHLINCLNSVARVLKDLYGTELMVKMCTFETGSQ